MVALAAAANLSLVPPTGDGAGGAMGVYDGARLVLTQVGAGKRRG